MLGASPDGMLLHDMNLTAVEIKCPFPFQPMISGMLFYHFIACPHSKGAMFDS
jgi:hypothetical protein